MLRVGAAFLQSLAATSCNATGQTDPTRIQHALCDEAKAEYTLTRIAVCLNDLRLTPINTGR